MDLKFGTDGIRGPVENVITPEACLKIGHATGIVMKELGWNTVLIGKDTRISGYMLESALESGFSSAGVDVFLTGPIPTPAIAYLTKTLKAIRCNRCTADDEKTSLSSYSRSGPSWWQNRKQRSSQENSMRSW